MFSGIRCRGRRGASRRRRVLPSLPGQRGRGVSAVSRCHGIAAGVAARGWRLRRGGGKSIGEALTQGSQSLLGRRTMSVTSMPPLEVSALGMSSHGGGQDVRIPVRHIEVPPSPLLPATTSTYAGVVAHAPKPISRPSNCSARGRRPHGNLVSGLPRRGVPPSNSLASTARGGVRPRLAPSIIVVVLHGAPAFAPHSKWSSFICALARLAVSRYSTVRSPWSLGTGTSALGVQAQVQRRGVAAGWRAHAFGPIIDATLFQPTLNYRIILITRFNATISQTRERGRSLDLATISTALQQLGTGGSAEHVTRINRASAFRQAAARPGRSAWPFIPLLPSVIARPSLKMPPVVTTRSISSTPCLLVVIISCIIPCIRWSRVSAGGAAADRVPGIVVTASILPLRILASSRPVGAFPMWMIITRVFVGIAFMLTVITMTINSIRLVIPDAPSPGGPFTRFFMPIINVRCVKGLRIARLSAVEL